MFKNYLKTALRNLWRQKGYSFINISGLAIGMAACMLIFIYIINEFSFDKFHDDYQNIYRTAMEGEVSGDFLDVAVSSGPMAWAMVSDFPEVISATRITPRSTTSLITYNDKNIYEENLYFVDSTFFDIFSFKFLKGDPNTALNDHRSIILTEKVAEKIFGQEDPMGKMITINNGENTKVTGILENIPTNTHLEFNMLCPISENYDNWGALSLYTYIRVVPGTDPQKLTEKFPDFLLKYMPFLSETEHITFRAKLQPLSDIHLHSNLMVEITTNSDFTYIILFGAIAIFILIIACINFMNLTTARSIGRAREVGLRKVVGANRGLLIIQFIGESIILSLFAMIIALILVELVMPVFNNLTGQDLSLGILSAWQIPFILVGLILFVGLIAGSYPAFYLSAFQPIKVLKGDLYKGNKKSVLRNVLVVTQFTISIILLISTLLVYSQMEYIQSKKLGFDKENVVVLPLRSDKAKEDHNLLRNDLLNLSGIETVSSALSVPGRGLNGSGYQPEGIPEDAPWIIYTLYGDFYLPEALGMNIIQGRNFDPANPADSNNILINETLVNKLGWEEPVGKSINTFRNDDETLALKVIGVVEDYHFKSLHDPIEPAMIRISQGNPSFAVIKTQAGNIEKNLNNIKTVWENLHSNIPFDYFFLDKSFNSLYRAEQKMSKIFIYFTFLAIIIASLGLFGLAAFAAEQRTKEIGIRKALGASTPKLVAMITVDLTKWILLANIIAWPVSYYFLNEWLQNFAFRINILNYLWLFVAASIIALAIAILTVIYQAIKVSTDNPVDALKYE